MAGLLLVIIIAAPWLEQHYFRFPGAAVLLIIYAVANFLAPIELVLIALSQAYNRMDFYAGLMVARAALLLPRPEHTRHSK